MAGSHQENTHTHMDRAHGALLQVRLHDLQRRVRKDLWAMAPQQKNHCLLFLYDLILLQNAFKQYAVIGQNTDEITI